MFKAKNNLLPLSCSCHISFARTNHNHSLRVENIFEMISFPTLLRNKYIRVSGPRIWHPVYSFLKSVWWKYLLQSMCYLAVELKKNMLISMPAVKIVICDTLSSFHIVSICVIFQDLCNIFKSLCSIFWCCVFFLPCYNIYFIMCELCFAPYFQVVCFCN